MMRFSMLMVAALLSGSVANAQNDPVVMTINGQPVTRSEFEYSYNKNNSETVVDKKSRSSCFTATSRYVRRSSATPT